MHFYALELALMLSFTLCVESTIEKLKCYQCDVRETSQCTNEHLETCPDDQAYDSCLTRIYKTKADGVWIRKACALAPCSLRDHSQSTGLGFDYCDRSQAEYDCVNCCKESGCNTGRGTNCFPTLSSVVALTCLTYFFGTYWFTKSNH